MKENKERRININNASIKKKYIEKDERENGKEKKKGKKEKKKIEKGIKQLKNKTHNFIKSENNIERNTKSITKDIHKISKENNKKVVKENSKVKKNKKISKTLKKLNSKNGFKKEKISSVVKFLNKNQRKDLKRGDKQVTKKMSLNKDKELGKSNKDTMQNKNEEKKVFSEKEILEKKRRTIFVGNVPLKNVTALKLLKILNIKRSMVESIRFRSLPLEEKYAKKKKLGVILKKFTDVKDNKNALITLKDEAYVSDVLNKNGTIYDGYVLRINKIGDNNFFNKKKSICIKNLHKTLNEKDLYELMKEIDEIKGIRILRDNITSCSMGVAFILFKNRISVKKAIKEFNGKIINGRAIVVQNVFDRKQVDATKKEKKETIKKEISKKFKKNMKKKKKYFRKKKGNKGVVTN